MPLRPGRWLKQSSNDDAYVSPDEADLRAVYLRDQPGSGECEPASPTAANGPRMQAGQAIYDDQCSGCHAKDATGNARLFPALKGKVSP
jgi:mono/diheme cytochrome c family protein